MEVVREDGSQIQLKPGQTRELGRADGLNSTEKTISRRHISFFVPGVKKNEEFRVQFEVLGRNPVYVRRDNQVKIFRRLERGEMGDGDTFCVSAKNPVRYTVRKIENGGEGVRRNDLESELGGSWETGFGFNGVEHLLRVGVDISAVDPVKEFGFVVEGHEFDSYPMKMIKNWDWFLEEEGKDIEDEDDDDEGKKRKARGRRKRKKGTENDDEEWTGESEDDKVLINKSRKAQQPKYMTRSKDHGKLSKDKCKSRSPTRTRNRNVDDEEDEEDEDENDETLGGFIVDDENLEGEEEIGEAEEDEEEELADEYDEDEDEDEDE